MATSLFICFLYFKAEISGLLAIGRLATAMKEKNTRLFCCRIIWILSRSPIASVGGEHVAVKTGVERLRERLKVEEAIADVSADGKGEEGEAQIRRQQKNRDLFFYTPCIVLALQFCFSCQLPITLRYFFIISCSCLDSDCQNHTEGCSLSCSLAEPGSAFPPMISCSCLESDY